jgi:hypothetical protein
MHTANPRAEPVCIPQTPGGAGVHTANPRAEPGQAMLPPSTTPSDRVTLEGRVNLGNTRVGVCPLFLV